VSVAHDTISIMGESLATLMVLRALLEEPAAEMYGLEIGSAAGLKGGSLFPALDRLEKRGWITSRWEDIGDATESGRRRRRYYRLTADGAREAATVLRDTARALAPPRHVLRGLGA
jgi:DNA-binding PadR family transcriptional regulator